MIYVSIIHAFDNKCSASDCPEKVICGHFICNKNEESNRAFFNVYCVCENHNEAFSDGISGDKVTVQSRFILKMLRHYREKDISKYSYGNALLRTASLNLIEDFILQRKKFTNII